MIPLIYWIGNCLPWVYISLILNINFSRLLRHPKLVQPPQQMVEGRHGYSQTGHCISRIWSMWFHAQNQWGLINAMSRSDHSVICKTSEIPSVILRACTRKMVAEEDQCSYNVFPAAFAGPPMNSIHPRQKSISKNLKTMSGRTFLFQSVHPELPQVFAPFQLSPLAQPQDRSAWEWGTRDQHGSNQDGKIEWVMCFMILGLIQQDLTWPDEFKYWTHTLSYTCLSKKDSSPNWRKPFFNLRWMDWSVSSTALVRISRSAER